MECATLGELLAGGMKPGADLGPANYECEVGYRRGYHHCAVDIARFINQNGPITTELLQEWINGVAIHWRKSVPRERKIIAPAFLPDDQR
ncbi:hypothetical protein ALP79_200423 [Pseudomonas savastanoi pv. fraxini]|uniref:hypothetical protein n=1 Tax=Pseudomonas savastanoi TaxID=29438 RepID=UPI0007422870|nr:hypothetical protein [Pseudomonas savastanoi]KUG43886.1 hypothetical protein ALP79_200423 [Pseudomonas savastanoi pv. fraxini]